MTLDTHKNTYAGAFVLKLLDLDPDDGGVELPIDLPHAYEPLDAVLQQLAVEGLVDLDRKRGTYVVSPRGYDYIATLIDEAETYIDEFDDEPAAVIVEEVRRRNLDPLRVRFLWGWYQGEFDDLVLFQQRRGLEPVETDWAAYLLSDPFYTELRRDLTNETPALHSADHRRS